MQVDSATIVLLLLLVGIATGGLTGASGMSVLISGLLMMGIDIREVIGLTFLVTLVNSMTSVIPYWRGQLIDLRLAAFLSLSAMLAVIVGHQLAGRVPDSWLRHVMIAALFLAGLRVTLSRSMEQVVEGTVRRPPNFLVILLGTLIGLIYGGDEWWQRTVHRSRADDRLPDTGQAGNRYFDFSNGGHGRAWTGVAWN